MVPVPDHGVASETIAFAVFKVRGRGGIVVRGCGIEKNLACKAGADFSVTKEEGDCGGEGRAGAVAADEDSLGGAS